MRGVVFAFLTLVAVLAIAAVSASPVPATLKPATPIPARGSTAPGAGGLCDLCINFAVAAINDLLNIILNSGIITGCADLCSKLPNKYEADVCDLLCDGVGLDEFIHILERSDIDPIYYCELVHACKIVDCQGDCLDIDSLVIRPQSAKYGATFQATVDFSVKQVTGTGMTRIDIIPSDPKIEPLQDDELEVGFQPGNYTMGIDIDSRELGFPPGDYTLQLMFCEGECGSKHPHSKIYSAANATFTITK